MAILSAAFSIRLDGPSDDDTNATYNTTVATIANATNTTAGVDCDATLGDLAVHFFDESCVAELSCEEQTELTDYMAEFLDPLRVELVFFIVCVVIFFLVVLQQGGIPSTTQDNAEKSRWKFGCVMWFFWMACVAFQYAMTASSAAASVFAFRR